MQGMINTLEFPSSVLDVLRSWPYRVTILYDDSVASGGRASTLVAFRALRSPPAIPTSVGEFRATHVHAQLSFDGLDPRGAGADRPLTLAEGG